MINIFVELVHKQKSKNNIVVLHGLICKTAQSLCAWPRNKSLHITPRLERVRSSNKSLGIDNVLSLIRQSDNQSTCSAQYISPYVYLALPVF